MEWHHTASPKKKGRTIPLAGKFMGAVSWWAKGCIMVISRPERKLSLQFTMLRHSRNCDVHFMTSN
jgi:hypothetical protein